MFVGQTDLRWFNTLKKHTNKNSKLLKIAQIKTVLKQMYEYFLINIA